jgi:hypothetical protein
MADQWSAGGFMTAGEYTQLVARERQAHGRALRALKGWGATKYEAREVLALVLEWEGIATKLEEAGK